VCDYVALPSNAVTIGAWTQVASCNGKCTIAETVTYGTEHSQSTTTTDEWSQTVTTSMESGFEIEGVGAKVSTSVASGFAHSSSFQDALSTSVSKSITVDCGEKSDDVQKLLYQFSTHTDRDCLNTGNCSGSTFTLDTVCVTDPAHGYTGPQCAPNACADKTCSVCTQ